jgi:hypothetical protein
VAWVVPAGVDEAVRGYAEQEVFSERERELWDRAAGLVAWAPYEIDGELVRCHELARAVGHMLDLDHEDGRFGFVEHTWLWTDSPSNKKFCPPWAVPNVLDVYTPGSMPMVQLVHMATGLPSRYVLTSLNDLEIRNDVIEELVRIFEEKKSW